ncbi:MAG TPA: sigma-70 family RNA polymerase sigma factor [Planctomycetes bacterium]|nr:sigma-70 family RNA polymerase sigma factor [Planctomycetota bacterium]
MTENDSSDILALVERARTGDRDALDELLRIHEPMLLRWARKRLGYPLRTLEETRDILQDTYAVVIRKIGSFYYEDESSFGRWLRGIVTRIVLQKAKGAHIRRRLALPNAERVPDLSATPSSAAQARELTRAKYSFLRELGRLDRLIYRMRMRGFSSVQIGDYVGLTDRAVRMRFAKAEARIRLKMQRLLQESRGDEDDG